MMKEESTDNFDVVGERNVLSLALLSATTDMAHSTAPEMVLRAICNALAASSDNIRLAWMKLGDLDANSLQPEFAVGRAAAWAQGLQISRAPANEHRPVREAIDRWETVTRDLPARPGKPDAAGLRSILSLPVGHKDRTPNGIVAIYASQPGYFEQVGIALFSAFIHLANAALEQAVLLHNLAHMANHDLLTGMLNRRGIQQELEKELSRCRRKGKRFSVMLFDIDRFKLINDRLGHQEGDIVLKGFADTSQEMVRREDSVGRWGGEEFICIAPETTCEEAMLLAERMRQVIRGTPIATSSGMINVTASFGVACYPEDASGIDKLVAAADAALYDAKRAGRDRTVSAELVSHDIYSIGNMLEAALRENRIMAAYQPIVDLRSGEVVAEETLARLLTPAGEFVPAAHFIHAAHQLQLLHRIDQTIMMQAFSHCVAGLASGTNRLTHFVNISADLLRHREVIDEMLTAARTYCSACTELIGEVKPMVIEITEQDLLTDITAARELLTPFINFGLRLALDDFGSGYSSYRYLADLDISFIKIDGELVKRINEPKVRAILQGIQDTAEALGIRTVAESVEDEQTESLLRKIGVHWAQGFYYGRPALDSRHGLTVAPLPCIQVQG